MIHKHNLRARELSIFDIDSSLIDKQPKYSAICITSIKILLSIQILIEIFC